MMISLVCVGQRDLCSELVTKSDMFLLYYLRAAAWRMALRRKESKNPRASEVRSRHGQRRKLDRSWSDSVATTRRHQVAWHPDQTTTYVLRGREGVASRWRPAPAPATAQHCTRTIHTALIDERTRNELVFAFRHRSRGISKSKSMR